MARRGYDAANVVKYNVTSKLLTKKVMEKGDNYEICNPLEHLTEAFAGVAKFADFADSANSST